MRVAAVAFVLIVGAAVVLAFANTLNSWVLGGLLGGLAAILLSIPISLALFTFLARRHDTRQNSLVQSFEDEPDFTDDVYDEPALQNPRGYFLPVGEDFSMDPRARARYSLENCHLPVSGFLPLPPAGHDLDAYEDDQEQYARRDPRNYPRQPRFPVRSLARDGEIKSPPPQTGSRRNPSTRSLAQHQSAALRKAREEAQRQHIDNRAGPGTSPRHPQGSRSSSAHRPRSPRPPSLSTGASQIIDEYDPRFPRQRGARPAWSEDEDFTTEQYPRRPGYPRQPRVSRSRSVDPWTGTLEDEDDQDEPGWPRGRRASENMSGTLHNPLVRRAPYLYDDDPLREEFAQQLNNTPPITRRSSLFEHYEDEEEY